MILLVTLQGSGNTVSGYLIFTSYLVLKSHFTAEFFHLYSLYSGRFGPQIK